MKSASLASAPRLRAALAPADQPAAAAHSAAAPQGGELLAQPPVLPQLSDDDDVEAIRPDRLLAQL
jgi:hypothetical protein